MKQEIYEIGFWNYIKTTLNKLSANIGSPPANNWDPLVFRSIARIELLSLSAM